MREASGQRTDSLMDGVGVTLNQKKDPEPKMTPMGYEIHLLIGKETVGDIKKNLRKETRYSRKDILEKSQLSCSLPHFGYEATEH